MLGLQLWRRFSTHVSTVCKKIYAWARHFFKGHNPPPGAPPKEVELGWGMIPELFEEEMDLYFTEEESSEDDAPTLRPPTPIYIHPIITALEAAILGEATVTEVTDDDEKAALAIQICWAGYRTRNRILARRQWRLRGLVKRLLRLSNSQRMATAMRENLAHSGFPRLNHEAEDRCDCWKKGEKVTSANWRVFLAPVLGESTPPEVRPLSIGTDNGLLIRSLPSGKNLISIHRQGFEYFYEVFETHQVEGVAGLIAGHNARLVVTVKRLETQVRITQFAHNSLTSDLSHKVDTFFQTSDIRNSGRNEDIMPRTAWGLVNDLISEAEHFRLNYDRELKVILGDEMVELQGVMVPRETKRFYRALRRQLDKHRRVAGIPKRQKVRLPDHLRNLTTQEYREVVLREQEELIDWFAERKQAALSQEAKQWYKSPYGTQWRWRVIKLAVEDRIMAEQEWVKFTSHLARYDCPHAKFLPFPSEQVIERARTEKNKRLALRAQQLEASSSRVFVAGKGLVPASHHELAVRKVHVNSWADDENDDFLDEDLVFI